jgi:predicted nucleic acid-binding Zn finger protein
MDCCERGFQELLMRIQAEGVTSECLHLLTALLPKALVNRAFQLLAIQGTIKRTVARTSRWMIWSVTTSGNCYYVFLGSARYCSCPSYARDVIQKGSYPLCKHALACSICDALKTRGDTQVFRSEEMPDDQFSQFLIRTAISTNLGVVTKR